MDEAQKPEASEPKKAYVPPQLTELGKLDEVTLQNSLVVVLTATA